MKFLIVDDSRLVRMKLKAELCDRGHSVVEAQDGEEALARVLPRSLTDLNEALILGRGVLW